MNPFEINLEVFFICILLLLCHIFICSFRSYIRIRKTFFSLSTNVIIYPHELILKFLFLFFMGYVNYATQIMLNKNHFIDFFVHILILMDKICCTEKLASEDTNKIIFFCWAHNCQLLLTS